MIALDLTQFPLQPSMTEDHPQFGMHATNCIYCGQMSAIRDRLTRRRECKPCIMAWQQAEILRQEEVSA